MARKEVKNSEGRVDTGRSIDARASEFLESLCKTDTSDPAIFKHCVLGLRDFIDPAKDRNDQNSALVTAAYSLALDKLGFNPSTIQAAIKTISRSTRSELDSILKPANVDKRLENTITNAIRSAVVKILGNPPKIELNEFARKTRITRPTKNVDLTVKEKPKSPGELADEKIIASIQPLLQNIHTSKPNHSSLIQAANLLRTVLPKHIVDMMENGPSPEARMNSKS